MISAGSYKLFELEILHRILCKSLVKKRSLISCVHPSILGAGDAVSEVTTSIRTASLFLKVVFFFLLAASHLSQNWSANKVCAAGRLFQLFSLPTPWSPPPPCKEERMFLVISLCTGELL